MKSRGVQFEERDIERDPGARGSMQQALANAGKSGNGVPVIDFRGTIIQGFDRASLERLTAAQSH